jgi:hypothetical protein
MVQPLGNPTALFPSTSQYLQGVQEWEVPSQVSFPGYPPNAASMPEQPKFSVHLASALHPVYGGPSAPVLPDAGNSRGDAEHPASRTCCSLWHSFIHSLNHHTNLNQLSPCAGHQAPSEPVFQPLSDISKLNVQITPALRRHSNLPSQELCIF